MTPELNKDNLGTGSADYYSHEYVVVKDPLKDVPFAMTFSGVDLVKDLHPDESVEEDGPMRCGVVCVVRCLVQFKECLTVEQDDQHYNHLVYRMSDDVFQHGTRNERLGSAVRFPV